ncbi:MAG: hypothetical protein V1792_25880 [Pseudomonadota bacterium]
MKSQLAPDFISCFRKLPVRIQRLARKNYTLWKENPAHSGLQFKRVGKRMPVYSVRVGIGWRALGLMVDDVVVWFWIGSHAEYELLLREL